MLAYVSLVLAVTAAVINLGWLELSTGHWPGISLGLAAALAGALQLRSDTGADASPRRRPPRARVLAWIGIGLGLAAALLGIAVYLGWGIAAGRVG